MDKEIENIIEMAKSGNAECQYKLGCAYMSGELVDYGIDIDMQKSAYWFYSAALQGHYMACFNVGIMFEDGVGFKQSFEKAFYWYKKSAEIGYSRAQLNVGNCYALGQGVEKSDEQAIIWWEKSARQDNLQAQYNLGYAFATGKRGEKSEQKAIYWWEKAGSNKCADSQFNLAVFYNDKYLKEPNEILKNQYALLRDYWLDLACEQKHDKAIEAREKIKNN